MAADCIPDPAELPRLNAEFAQAGPGELLRWAQDRFGARAAIGTSFQASGLVLLHHAATQGLTLRCFTIDTGLLFAESVALRQQVESFFGIVVEVLQPELSLAQQAREFGPELWKRQPDTCCTLRKVLPLQARLATLDAWITGLRQDQGGTRAQVQRLELYQFDPLRDRFILKINPLAGWSKDEVWAYVREHRLPYNPLAERGFRSIGCQPCTRPVGDHEGERAGRWTGFHKTECGIHTFMGAHV
ncbi:MAG: phosphoadenylyl-sulfate reductase [Verrucomicrobia bacterium]|nr:phosphoadenylyl-sulfate reductase [Verrucomicrobiota bacterium]